MHQKTVPERQAMLAGRQRQLKGTGAILPDELAALQTQQRVLAIDLAGARAQMETATKLLFNRNRLSPSRIEQLESVKIAAEIELARLHGRQKILSSLIAEAQQQQPNSAGEHLAAAQSLPHQEPPPLTDLAIQADAPHADAPHADAPQADAPQADAPRAGLELLDYCEALCASDLKFHDPEDLPAPPLSAEHRGTQGATTS